MIGMLGLAACMVMNWDATQFVIDPNGDMRVFKCKDEANKVASLVKDNDLPHAIKWYWLHNAAGQVAHPVFCIADDSLAEDAFEFYQVFGLGVSMSPGDYGWLIITKTRNGNDKFYNWFATHVVFEFVDTIYASVGGGLWGSDGEKMPVFIACDGEYIQIKAFQDSEILRGTS
jgi:hypothetical protein